MSKKLISLLLAIVMLFCLSACGETETSSNPTNTPSESQTDTTQNTDDSTILQEIETKLSDSCDKVLASGYDENNNYYELVGNETEDYIGSHVKIGIVKNNEWLLPITTDMPMVDADGSFGGGGLDNGIVSYIGNGCFMHRYLSEGDWKGVFYNANNSKFYIGTVYGVYAQSKYLPVPSQHIIVDYKNYLENPEFTILNTNDMSTRQIRIDGVSLWYFCPISENVFAVHTSGCSAFYDINGNKVIELSNYNIEKHQNMYFKNQQCTFLIENDNGSEYKITIDKTGNVINSVLE